jgi:hypothetical protein
VARDRGHFGDTVAHGSGPDDGQSPGGVGCHRCGEGVSRPPLWATATLLCHPPRE